MGIVWIMVLIVFGFLSKVWSDREKSQDTLWEDGGWKKKSTRSWGDWFKQKTEEEKFEAALILEKQLLNSKRESDVEKMLLKLKNIDLEPELALDTITDQ
jgi:hypothetical protein